MLPQSVQLVNVLDHTASGAGSSSVDTRPAPARNRGGGGTTLTAASGRSAIQWLWCSRSCKGRSQLPGIEVSIWSYS